MPETLDTTNATIVDPNNPEAQIANPDYVKPEAAAPAAAAEPLDLAKPAAAPTTVQSTGNTVIDSVGSLLAEKSVPGASDIIENFAETGEVSLVDQATLVESLGETVAKMAIDRLGTEASKLQEASTASRTEVLDYANTAFNGDSPDVTWTQIQEFVHSPEAGFSAEDKAVLTGMINKGGLSAKLAIDNIHSVYAKDSNTTIPADLIAGDSLAQGKTFEAISALDYSTQLDTLLKTNAYDSPKVQQLQRRRDQSRAQGFA